MFGRFIHGWNATIQTNFTAAVVKLTENLQNISQKAKRLSRFQQFVSTFSLERFFFCCFWDPLALTVMSSQPGSRPRSALVLAPEETPVLKQGEQYTFAPDIDNIKMLIKWTTRQIGMICDLELMVFMYDERVSAVLVTGINKIFHFMLFNSF